MSVDGLSYFYPAVPLRLRSATNILCQCTTKGVVFILNSEDFSFDVYVDNVYGAECTDSSQQAFQRLNSRLNELGIMS